MCYTRNERPWRVEKIEIQLTVALIFVTHTSSLCYSRGVRFSCLLPVVLAFLFPGCGGSTPAPVDTDAVPGSGDAKTDATPLPIPATCKGGRVTHVLGGQIFRSTLGDTVSTENISEGLNALSPGSDQWASASPGGDWLVMETERFDPECNGWACLALVKADLSSGEVIKIDGAIVHGDDLSAVATGGDRIVYPFGGGPHDKDLYVINRSGDSWSTPVLLTGDSTSTYNLQPAISADGSKVVFDCGEDPYGQPPTSICEVNTDGTGFRVVWTPEQGGQGAPGRSDVALHHPDYFSDGSIVFEADWTGEQIWRLSGDGPPVRIAGQYSNDNSPCVLDNDCIVSVWLERPENGPGLHELKLMDSQGGSFSMVRMDVDITDTGTYCSQ